MAAAKLLRDLWPAVAWVQSSCAWAAQSLLAHSPSEPVPLSSPDPPPARWRCSLIATGMALDRLLRVLSPASSVLPAEGPAHAIVGGLAPCRTPAAAHPGSSSWQGNVSSKHGHPAAVPFSDRSEDAGGLPTASGAMAQASHAAGQDREGGLGDEGEAWRIAQQALLALLEQEHAAGSAAHAWQVGTLALPNIAIQPDPQPTVCPGSRFL